MATAESTERDEPVQWPVRRYRDLYERSLQHPEEFWAEQARRLHWERTWETVLSWDPPFARWFVGGELNACYQCVDRHAEGWRRNKVAIYWEGEEGETRAISYAALYRDVNRIAAGLKSIGVKKDDRVALFLPMIPELPEFMLACARIGAIHTVVFSAFSAQALADRINDTGATVVVTADGGLRRGKTVPLKATADEAVKLAPSVERVIVVRRAGVDAPMEEPRDIWLEDLLSGGHGVVPPEAVEATHPLYILYTSGTTGKPKGIVHATGGYMVYATSAFQWAFDLHEESVYWCTADIGWVTGHSAIVYAPLAQGATSVMYEGAPDYPELDRWWEIIERYRVTALYTSPTAIRMFMQHGHEWPARHDLSSLEILGTVGEPINPEAWRWYYTHIGGERCPIVDTWWQTETGSFMIAPTPGIQQVPLKPGSAGFPLPGIDAAVVDEDGEALPPGEKGFLVIRRPWPGMLQTINNNPERYREAYWSKFPGLYNAGDYAITDEDGYFWILGRADEVIKVAGHRLGSLEIENAAVSHEAVAEAAAVSVPDEVTGEAVIVFAMLRDGYAASPELAAGISDGIREVLGAIAKPKATYLVSALPKTRSGKIMRRVLRSVATGQPIGDVATLENEASVEEVRRAYQQLQREV